ncbi:hypothetical protein [Clostridium sp. MCC353]|uniref:hypothetical protein n=1 Tax=Clostridium sp. MCC353 TaxID=2592646 RepID=UPI001C01E4AD|nr:hypothetical protein [Clostridium sp. MCC353]
MKNKGRWFWYLAVICMAEAAAALLISGYVFHDGYYFFEPSFEKSRYVERNLGNSVFDLIGVGEGWREEQWLGKLDKRDVEYAAEFGERKYSNVEEDHLFSEYDLSITWDGNGGTEIGGRLSPMFEKEDLKPFKFEKGALRAGIPEEKARAAESRWQAGRVRMAFFGIGMVFFLFFIWYAGSRTAGLGNRKENKLPGLIKVCILSAWILICMKYFRLFGIRIHRGTRPESYVILLGLLAALGAVAAIWLAEQIHYIKKR